jgi:hypothetical protein
VSSGRHLLTTPRGIHPASQISALLSQSHFTSVEILDSAFVAASPLPSRAIWHQNSSAKRLPSLVYNYDADSRHETWSRKVEVASSNTCVLARSNDTPPMPNNDFQRNYVSVKSWMWMMLVPFIPVFGQVMVLIWAFTGENESRRNFFRAVIAWLMIVATTAVVVVVLQHNPIILQHIQALTHKG